MTECIASLESESRGITTHVSEMHRETRQHDSCRGVAPTERQDPNRPTLSKTMYRLQSCKGGSRWHGSKRDRDPDASMQTYHDSMQYEGHI